MPVKWVIPWQPSPGTTVNSQVLAEVSQCPESLRGVKGGRWRSSLTFYRSMMRDQSVPAECPKDFLGLALQDRPDRYYFIIRGRIVVEADVSILAIMEKLQSYKARVSLHFEGLQYQVGDFLLRMGKVVPANSENLRGIMLENSPPSSMGILYSSPSGDVRSQAGWEAGGRAVQQDYGRAKEAELRAQPEAL